MAGLLVLCGCVLALVALIVAPILLAFAVVGAALKLVFFVLVLPFRLAGALIGVAAATVAWTLAVGLLFFLCALPLLPFLLIAGGLTLVFRAMRGRPTVSPSPRS